MNRVSKHNEVEKQRISNLLSTGRIGQVDYDILVAAIEGKASTSQQIVAVLINPFQKVSGFRALLFGMLFIGLLSLLGALSGLYFPGALDFQIVPDGKRLLTSGELVIENIVNVLSLSVLFYLGAIFCRQRNMRFIDFLGTLAFSRFPYVIFALILYLASLIIPGVIPHKDVPQQTLEVLFITLFAVFALVGQMVLIFSALRESSGLKGKSLWSIFTLGVILGEVMSYALNGFLFK